MRSCISNNAVGIFIKHFIFVCIRNDTTRRIKAFRYIEPTAKSGNFILCEFLALHFFGDFLHFIICFLEVFFFIIYLWRRFGNGFFWHFFQLPPVR